MCDYGVISGPAITSAIYGGAATAAQAGAVTAALQAASTAAVLAAGTGVSLYGANQAQKNNNAVAAQTNARNAQFQDQERQRQLDLQGGRDKAFQGAVDASSKAAHDANQATADAALTSTYSQPATDAQNSLIPGLTQNPDTQAGPRVVQDAYKDRLKGVGDYLRQQAGAKGALDAFTSANLAQSDAVRGASNTISLFNNFAQGSKSILPIEQGANNQGAQYEFQSNQNAADNAQGLGSLISGLGLVGNSLAANRTAKAAATPIIPTAKSKSKTAASSALGTSSFLPQ